MTTKDFLNKLSDPDLVKKIEAAKSLKDAYAFAQRYGVTDSFETFKKETKEQSAATGELTDDNLEMVTGGSSVWGCIKELIQMMEVE